jgi:hypothetical protein
MLTNDLINYPNSAALLSHYVKDVAKSTYRIGSKKISRDSFYVKNEYDEGYWKDVLKNKNWRNVSLNDFLTGRNRSERICIIEGKVARIKSDSYYRYRLSALQNLLADYSADSDEIIELGCGYGYNLLTLSNDAKWTKLMGFDISNNAILAGNEISAHYHLKNKIFLNVMDITNIDDISFCHVTDKIVFTYFCLEQLPTAIDTVIQNLLHHKPKRVINIEPASTMLSWLNLRDIVSKYYLYSVNYQRTLFSKLYEYEKIGSLKIIDEKRMQFAPTTHNDGQICVWEPI